MGWDVIPVPVFVVALIAAIAWGVIAAYTAYRMGHRHGAEIAHREDNQKLKDAAYEAARKDLQDTLAGQFRRVNPRRDQR